jgi:uncharacterized membrane protein required for colicin V production
MLAVHTADVGAAVILLAFVVWGVWRGAMRQLLSLLVIAVALFLAGHLSSNLEDPVSKVADLDATGRCIAAWAAVLVGGIVVGGIVVRLLGKSPERAQFPGMGENVGAAILGFLKGLVVLSLLSYAFLAWQFDGGRPSWADEVAGSRMADAIKVIRHAVEPVASLPECVRKKALEVDAVLHGP